MVPQKCDFAMVMRYSHETIMKLTHLLNADTVCNDYFPLAAILVQVQVPQNGKFAKFGHF